MNNTTDPIVEMCGYSRPSTFFIIREFPSRKLVIIQTLFIVASSMLIIPTVLLNGISVLTIWKSSHLKAKVCYFLILIQSGVDLAVGIVSVPAAMAHSAIELQGVSSCVKGAILQATAFILAGISLMTIWLLTFERYLSILHPVLHRSYVTKAKVLVCACCASVLITVTGPVIGIISVQLHNVLNCTMILIILAFNTFAYIRIYFKVKNMHFSNDGIGDYSTEESSSNLGEKRKLLRERNLAKSCALVVLIGYFCYIPYVVCYIYFEDDPINFRVATSWSGIVLLLNSSINSLVFFWKRPMLRQEALKVLRKMSSKF